MRTVDELVMRCAPSVIFSLAAEVERWPERLAHYRWVQFLSRDGRGGGVVQMAANRPFGVFNWPVWWESKMEIDDREMVIRYRHLQGVTTGMDVLWTFAAKPFGTLVRIVHEWDGPPAWPVGSALRGVVAREIIGPVFVHGIASRTLAGLAEHAINETG